jgi:hypothetical protein
MSSRVATALSRRFQVVLEILNEMVANEYPALSVVMIAGTCRRSAQRVLDAIDRQTCTDDALEVVVFDCGDPSFEPLRMPSRFASKELREPGLHYWRVARARAARETSAPVVAFLEDHCEPHPDWAERLIAAHADGRWAAVGYAFTNGSRDSWWSRAALMADYGMYVHPVEGGPSRILAGNNVSYARWFLDEIGAAFEESVSVDYNVQSFANTRGLPMKTAPDVLAAHRCYSSLWKLSVANYYYVRILSFARARSNGWGLATRTVWAGGALALVPALRTLRLARSVIGSPKPMTGFLSSLPVVLTVYVAAAFGEAAGYLFRLGDSEERFVQWELNTERMD